MASYLHELATTGLIPAIIFALVTWAVTMAQRRIPQRLRWRLRDESRTKVCVATSNSQFTGTYERKSSGVGQMKALAIISPALARGYRHLNPQCVEFSDDVTRELECDLVLLGGPKNNTITADVFSHLEKFTPLRLDGNGLRYPDGPEIPFDGPPGEPISTDYGIIARIRSPYSGKHTIVVLAGVHTYGVIAAARFFVDKVNIRHPDYWGDFIAVVRSSVRNEHVLAPTRVFIQRLPKEPK